MSINTISLVAFFVAPGIVVDDAIVVGENIFEHRQQGMDFLPAAITGARDIPGRSYSAFSPTLLLLLPNKR